METTEYPKTEIQLPLIDMTGGVSSISARQRNHKVEKTLGNFVNYMTKSMRLANPTPNREEQVICPH